VAVVAFNYSVVLLRNTRGAVVSHIWPGDTLKLPRTDLDSKFVFMVCTSETLNDGRGTPAEWS
jgi:hypothetical protein